MRFSKIRWLTASLTACVLLVVGQGVGWAKEKITYAYQIDPMFEAVLWAIKYGKVTSTVIEIDMTPLAISGANSGDANKTL